jgi:hypothetical protein
MFDYASDTAVNGRGCVKTHKKIVINGIDSILTVKTGQFLMFTTTSMINLGGNPLSLYTKIVHFTF